MPPASSPRPRRPAWVRTVAVSLLLALTIPLVLSFVHALTDRSGDPPRLGPVRTTTAADCSELAADPAFGGRAEAVAEVRGAGAVSCTVSVAADLATLAPLGLEAWCSTGPGRLTLPVVLSPSEDAWAVDLAELAARGC